MSANFTKRIIKDKLTSDYMRRYGIERAILSDLRRNDSRRVHRTCSSCQLPLKVDRPLVKSTEIKQPRTFDC